MKTTTTVTIAKELLSIHEEFPCHLNDFNDHSENEFTLYDFDQTWPSTALGFPGFGGQAITTARTYVFIPTVCGEDCQVYFGSSYAYSVPFSEKLMRDINDKKIEPVNNRKKYL